MHNRGSVGAPAKSFKDAIRRLFSELKGYRKLVVIALTLAILGSILSILAPDQLSNLADEISKGLVINTENLQTVSEKITENVSEDRIAAILSPNLTESNIQNILIDPTISSEDKAALQNLLTNKEVTATSFANLSSDILNKIFTTTTYEGVEISKEEKISFLGLIRGETLNVSEDFIRVLFPTIEVLDTTISSEEQYAFIKILGTLEGTADTITLYQKMDELPESIESLIAPTMDMDAILKIVYLLVGMYVASALFTYIQAICMTNVSNKFARDLRERISKKINALPLKYFDKHYTGDTLSRVTNDVDTIHQSMNQSLGSLASSITLFLGTILMMFITNWILALTAIVSSLIGFIGMLFILRNSQKYFVKRQEELGNLNGHIEEIYSGLNVVKVYNGKKASDEKFDVFNQNVCESSYKSQFLSGLMMPIMNFIGNFGYVMVCIVGALLTMNNVISFGVIIAFISYVRLFTSPLSQIAQSLTSLQSTAAASERVFEFLDEEEMSSEKDMTLSLDEKSVKGNIEFSHVVFKYDDADEPTIKDFTAKAKAGEKVAIVGPTGAGKTTMVNLLMKFYDINGGDILIDSVSTKKLTRENVHDLFTMVLQDTWLFEGTIRENIVYNRENVTDEQIYEVLKKVGLDRYVKTLPEGLDTLIGENDDLSAGEKQLLTIARGMINESPFLILDEATSNVDTRTEELVSKAMDELMKGKTSFIIAHRLSTIKNADLILVMKDGNIIEQGNHEELLKKNGFYAELYNSQFEL